jgi:hypothetical protein
LNQTPTSKYSGMTASQVYDAIKSRFTVKDIKGNSSIPNDPKTKEEIYKTVMGMGLPDGQDTQVLTMSGLSQKEIADFDKQYGVSSGN